MNKLFCEQVVAPGIVVALHDSCDSSRSTWGLTVPYAYWRERSRPDVVARFEEYSGSYPQIPLLEFSNSEEWKLRFGQFPTTVKPLCWLGDFLSDRRCSVPTVLWECSHRDGGRYYRQLLSWLPLIARGASRDFTREELAAECFGVREQFAHCHSIFKWQLDNPGWRTWQTVYEPVHPFHFTLF